MRKDAWQSCCNKREDKSNAYAERDKGEHVEVHRPYRPNTTDEEWPSAPEDDRSRQHELSPLGPTGGQKPFEGFAGDQVTHGVNGKRDGEDGADPESTGHIVEF